MEVGARSPRRSISGLEHVPVFQGQGFVHSPRPRLIPCPGISSPGITMDRVVTTHQYPPGADMDGTREFVHLEPEPTRLLIPSPGSSFTRTGLDVRDSRLGLRPEQRRETLLRQESFDEAEGIGHNRDEPSDAEDTNQPDGDK